MFKKILLTLVVLALLGGGGGVVWFKFMRPVDAFAAAKAAMDKGDLRAAQIELRNTVRSDPNNAEAHFRLGVIQLRMGDPVSGERSLRQARDNGFDGNKCRFDPGYGELSRQHELQSDDKRVGG